MIGALPLSEIMQDEAPHGCRVPSCPKPIYSEGYCAAHIRRLRRYGDTEPPTRAGAVGRLVARALDLADVDSEADAAWDAAVAELEHASDLLQRIKTMRPGRAPRAPKEPEAEPRKLTVARIRGAVFERARGLCEFCRQRPPREWFHVIGGPLRRKLESEETTAAACWPCHRAWERNDMNLMRAVKEWALRLGYCEALRAVEKRIMKVEEARR